MKHFSFRTKLVFIFTLMIVIEGFMIGSYSYWHAKNIVENVKKVELSDMVNRIDININVKVRSIVGLMEGTAFSLTLRDIMENGIINREIYLEEYFNTIKASDSSISNIFLIDDKEVVFSDLDQEGSENITILEFYENIAKDNPNKTMWLSTINSMYQAGEEVNQVIPVVTTIPGDKEDNDILGVLVCEIEPNTFSNLLLGKQNDFPNQFTYIIDKSQNVVATNNSGLKKNWIEEIDKKFQEGPRKFKIEIEGREYYVCGQYNGITGWRTFSIVLGENIFPQSRILKNSVLFFVGIITISVFVLIMIISYTLTKPINILTKAMKSVQEQNFALQIPNKRKDEIGKLTDSFNFMIGKIKTLIQEVYEKKLEQKNAELEALQAQINPHFLYNTLDSINWMLIDKDEYEISKIVVSLGDLMKYAINKKSVFVSIEEEFEYLQSYLIIQKKRLGERMKYSIEVEDKLKSFQIPKLLVQPILENAIIHGTEYSKENGIIKVRAYEKDDCVYIFVTDNGQGIRKEKLVQLLDFQYDNNYSGIGIQNVDKRLRLHYGEKYKLIIESDYGIGTKVTIRIPNKSSK